MTRLRDLAVVGTRSRREAAADLVRDGQVLFGVQLPTEAAESAAEYSPAKEVAKLESESGLESRLLLLAGMAALAQALTAPLAPEVPPPLPASEETRPPLPRALITPFQRFLQEPRTHYHYSVLAALCRQIIEHGFRLPHFLLPDVIPLLKSVHGFELKALLGQHGVWLAQQNPDWAWLVQRLQPAALPTFEELQSVWLEGAPAARKQALRTWRQLDSTAARLALQAVWLEEKADRRADWLACLEVGLSQQDEPFVASCLQDRSLLVVAAAVDLLARLPDSDFVQRMSARMQGFIQPDGSMTAPLPKNLPDDWYADGIRDTPPFSYDRAAWWLTQLVAVLPMSYWSAPHFGSTRTPADWIAQVRSTELAAAWCWGWTMAVLRQPPRDCYTASNPATVTQAHPGDAAPSAMTALGTVAARQEPTDLISAWAGALWRYWLEYRRQPNRVSALTSLLEPQLPSLLLRMSVPEAERCLERWLDRDWESLADTCFNTWPMPWSAELSRRFLHELFMSTVPDSASGLRDTVRNLWSQAAVSLDPSAFAEALLLPRPDPKRTGGNTASQGFDRFLQVIRLRQTFAEELSRGTR